MSSYQVIDEPKPTLYDNFVVNPVVILFAALLIPLFIDLPAFGRYWMPLLWITVNGFLMGSPTKMKELLIAILGVITFAALFAGMIYLSNTNVELSNFIAPYFRIGSQATLFFTLYLIVYYQGTPYAIFEYVKEQNKNR